MCSRERDISSTKARTKCNRVWNWCRTNQWDSHRCANKMYFRCRFYSLQKQHTNKNAPHSGRSFSIYYWIIDNIYFPHDFWHLFNKFFCFQSIPNLTRPRELNMCLVCNMCALVTCHRGFISCLWGKDACAIWTIGLGVTVDQSFIDWVFLVYICLKDRDCFMECLAMSDTRQTHISAVHHHERIYSRVQSQSSKWTIHIHTHFQSISDRCCATTRPTERHLTTHGGEKKKENAFDHQSIWYHRKGHQREMGKRIDVGIWISAASASISAHNMLERVSEGCV